MKRRVVYAAARCGGSVAYRGACERPRAIELRVQSVLVRRKVPTEDLVERIRRLVHSKPARANRMEAAS